MAGSGVIDARQAWRVAGTMLAVLVIALAVRSLAANWATLREQQIAWRFSIGWIGLSVGMVLTIYAVLIEGWRRIVCNQRQSLTVRQAARIWLLASLGKYVPGKLWSVAGAWMLARQAGVEPSTAVVAAVIMQVLSLVGGVLTVAVVAPTAFAAAGSGVTIGALALGAGGVLGLALLSSRAALDRVQRWLPASAPRLGPIGARSIAIALGANLFAWMGYGLAFVWLTRGLMAGVPLSWAEAVGAFTSAYLVGFVALFAPGGVGARESVLVLVLLPLVGPKAALALALASRIQLTATELGAALPFLVHDGLPSRTEPPTPGD